MDMYLPILEGCSSDGINKINDTSRLSSRTPALLTAVYLLSQIKGSFVADYLAQTSGNLRIAIYKKNVAENLRHNDKKSATWVNGWVNATTKTTTIKRSRPQAAPLDQLVVLFIISTVSTRVRLLRRTSAEASTFLTVFADCK